MILQNAYKYLSLIKFSHTVFALPFAFVGYFLALHTKNFSFDWKLIILIVLCMIFARTAAMAFNRYIDRHYDKKNPRTKNREIPAGKINPESALLLTIIAAVFFITTTYFINYLVFYLSPVALAVILGYSYTKRFTYLCHFILGLGLSLAPVGAYLAVTAHFDLTPILFGIIVLFWTAGFDIIYALSDDDFDKTNKLHSIPAFIGRKNALLISWLLHIAAAIVLILIGIYNNFGLFYWIGSIVFTIMLIYQHLIVKPYDISKINIAFATTNGIASIIFSLFYILDYYYFITLS